MHRTRFVVLLALVALVALGAAGVASAAVPTNSAELRNAVTVAGIMEHEEAFQAIADENGGTRASGTPGYDASAEYVAERLRAAGYDVTVQEFTFPFFEELAPATFSQTAPTAKTYADGEDFAIMEYSGSGTVVDAPVVPTNDVQIPPGPTPSSSNSGCEASDFTPASATEDQVALVQRGTCDFVVKAENAEAAGYDAVIIFNEGQDGRTEVLDGTLGGPGVTIPVIGTSFAIGQELFLADGARVSISTSTTSENRLTSNVIAETPTGRADRVAFSGAHLDSVPEGPGINDNGSGSATILEVAEEMSELGIQPRNKVRFAFWGAEESGLLGAEYYVSQLSKREQKNIAAYLNYDMVGSPNYVRFVYDGDGSDTPLAGPTGSAQIEDVYTEYFASQGLASEATEFSGRSDYGPFIDVGIPSGGLFTGAEGAKTAEQAEVYGGLSTFNGEPVSYDPCYHQACDSFDQEGTEGYDPALYAALDASYGGALVGNVNTLALDEMSDAAAHATLTFAQTTSAVNGTGQGKANGATDMEFQGSNAKK